MKYAFLSIILLLSSNIFGQKEFCHPKKIERVANKLIRKLSKEDFKSVMQITKDSAVDNQLFMVHERNKRKLKPVYKYLKNKGCDYFFVDKLEEIILEYTYYKMHKKDTCMSELLQPYIDNHFTRKERYGRSIKADSIDGVYIPKGIKECFEQIDFYWTDSLKTEVKKMKEEDFSASAHFGFGRWMRNNWGLWGGSRLKTYFYEMEIYHPDGMSGIILDSYHRYLNGKEIKLEEQIKFYQAYWDKVKEEEKKNRKWWEFRKNKNLH